MISYNLLNVSLVLVLLLLDDTRTILGSPVNFEGYSAAEGDMVTVNSLRREVRQPMPERIATEVADLTSSSNTPTKAHDQKKHIKNSSGKSNEGGIYKTYGSDADGEKGYLKKTFSKGDHGYKTLDTFHKKLGDRYGFEEHEAFGKAAAKDEAKHEAKSGSQKSKNGNDHEGAGTDVETHYADDDDGEDHSEYTEGGDEGEHYSEGGEGEGEGEGEGDRSYNEGDTEGYSESYSSGDSDGYGSQGSYSSGGESSSEEGDGESYY